MPTAISSLYNFVREQATPEGIGVYLVYDTTAKSYDIVVFPLNPNDPRSITELKAIVESDAYTARKNAANAQSAEPEEQADFSKLAAVFDSEARRYYTRSLIAELEPINMTREDEGLPRIEFTIDGKFDLKIKDGDKDIYTDDDKIVAEGELEAAKKRIKAKPTYNEDLLLRQAAQNKSLLETPISSIAKPPTTTSAPITRETPPSPKKANFSPLNALRNLAGRGKSKASSSTTLGGDSDEEVELSEIGTVTDEAREEATSSTAPLAGRLAMPERKSEAISGKLEIPKTKEKTAGELGLPKRKPEPFPASPSKYGVHSPRIITWTRAYYGLGESNVQYPITFAKARTAQTDSNEFMKFFGQFLKEINEGRPGAGFKPTKKQLQDALFDIRTTEVVFPYNSLKEVLLRSHNTDGTERPAELYDYIHWMRLNQYARNSFPFGYDTEDSEYISERMNKFGWGSRPRAEMEAALETAIKYYGISSRQDDDKGNYTITQEDDNGTVNDIIKVHVGKHGGMVTFDLQPGIAPENKEAAIRTLVKTTVQHIQQNCSNSYEAKLGGNIYDNIFMLQLLIYEENMHVTFKGMDQDKALDKMFRQIDALGLDAAKAKELKDEVQWLVSHAQTFDTTITHSGSKEILQTAYTLKGDDKILTPEEILSARQQGLRLEPLSLDRTQELFLARSQTAISSIFAKPTEPTPPSEKLTEPDQGFARSMVRAAANKLTH